MASIFVLVNGFAKSGKSTLTNQLELNNIPSQSSSDVLSEETLGYFRIPTNKPNLLVLEQKNEIAFQKLVTQFTPKDFLEGFLIALNDTETFKSEGEIEVFGNKRFNIRNAKIYVAEYIIVPRFGRNFFVDECLVKLNQVNNPIKVIFTTIPSEHVILIENIKKDSSNTILLCNLRRNTELTGVDSRQLFDNPDFEIINDAISKDMLYNLFINYITLLIHGK